MHFLHFQSPLSLVRCPPLQVPVNVLEDRLFGSVDVKKTLETGDTVFTPGAYCAVLRCRLLCCLVFLLIEARRLCLAPEMCPAFVDASAFQA
jgi:hypothetical protein